MLTLRGELPREETARFLRACFTDLVPQDECFVWDGWQNAVAMLGLVELAPLVKQAFEREFIDPQSLDFEEFEEELHRVVSGGPPPAWHGEREFELFDTVEELSSWAYPDTDEDEWEAHERGERVPDERLLWSPRQGPAVNPYKDIGRNDPCPCGSGKKFKKCCLGKVDALSPTDSSFPQTQFDVDAGSDDVFSDRAVLDDDETAYDPLVAPDPDEWLALDEDERIGLVMDFHRRAGVRLPDARVHAMAHAAVESQIAAGDALPVRRTLERLMSEGLDRHDAVHAIGLALVGHLNDIMKAGRIEGDPNLAYFAELEHLTAEDWRRSG